MLSMFSYLYLLGSKALAIDIFIKNIIKIKVILLIIANLLIKKLRVRFSILIETGCLNNKFSVFYLSIKS